MPRLHSRNTHQHSQLLYKLFATLKARNVQLLEIDEIKRVGTCEQKYLEK